MRQLKINRMKETMVVDKMTNPSDAATIAKQEKNTVDAAKYAINLAKKTGEPVTISEEMLEEGGFLQKLGLPAAILAGMFLVGQINSSDPEIQRLEAEYENATTDAEKDSIQDEITKRLIFLDTGKEDIQEKKAKPDFLDLDKDGDTKESMKKAAADKKKKATNEVNTTSPSIGPYMDLYTAVYNDWGKDSDVFKALGHALYFQQDVNKAVNVLKNYDVYDDYQHLLGLNEAKEVTLPDDTVFTLDLKHLMQKHGKDNTIKLSKALMKKLHDKGEISVNGTTITFKPSSKEETNENVEMQTLDVEVPLTNDFGRQNEPNYIDDEGRMAKSQLHKMREYTDKLTAMLDDNTQLEGWVQAKLTKASDYLSAVFHYLDYEMGRRGEGETSVQEINMDFSNPSGGKGGRRYIPKTFDVNLNKIQSLNQLSEGPHIKLMSKPDGSVVIGISPFLKIALEESQRGRTSRDTEIRKRPLLKRFQEIFAEDSQFKGALKQSLDGAKQQSTPFGELFISKLKANINKDKGILSIDNPSVSGMSDIFEEQ
jgi:hypothetical protein